MIITEQVKSLCNIGRSLNAEYLCLNNDKIYGLDCNMHSNLKFADNNPLEFNAIIPVNLLSELEKFYKATKVDIVFRDNNIVCDEISVPIYHDNIEIQNYFNTLNTSLTSIMNSIGIIGTPEYIENNFHDNIDFKTITSMKAGDGIGTIKLGKYIMTLFSNTIKVNKGDKVDLEIYDLGETFLSRFIVDKKKFKVYNHIRFLNLIRE